MVLRTYYENRAVGVADHRVGDAAHQRAPHPAEIRVYVRGGHFDQTTLAQQRCVFEGGGSEPPGPGKNSAGLAVFRYETKCGTVWGHTGNTLGYTQFMAASPDGRRSVTVSINSQHIPKEGVPAVFKALRRLRGRLGPENRGF